MCLSASCHKLENFTAGSSYILVNWVTLIRAGFEKVVIAVNVDSLGHARGH